MNDEMPETVAGGEVALYQDADGEVRVQVRLDRETVWLTQRQMAEVFDSTPENVLMHLRNMFASGELEADATTKEFLSVRTEGRRKVRRRLKHYNLDAIISVGYRVNTKRGVRFHQWATRTLHGHLVQGFTVDERRLAERGLRESLRGGGEPGPFVLRDASVCGRGLQEAFRDTGWAHVRHAAYEGRGG